MLIPFTRSGLTVEPLYERRRPWQEVRVSLLRDYAAMTPVRVSGDPQDEEAWGFRARPAGNALWKEPEVFYAVGDRARCDQVRAGLGTPTEECWGPVYCRRE